jgi:peroxiredoxin Q/BCP
MIELFNIVDKAIGVGSQSPIEAGSIGPDFTLQDQDGRTTRLYDLRGRPIILIFYPRDDTPVCTSQLAAFEAALEKLAPRGGQVFGVNPGSAPSHAAFKASLGISYDLLVDEGARVAKQWHAVVPLTGRVWRTVYGITSGGRIAFAERGNPDPERVVRALGMWNPPEPPEDEGVPVDELLQVGEPGANGPKKKARAPKKSFNPNRTDSGGGAG